MNNNLIFYINKLSTLIVSQELEQRKNQNQSERGDRYYSNCVKKVRQKGCDVLLHHSAGTPLEDPCVTDYGGNWSPVTLLIDYGKELESEGGKKYNEMMKSCLQILQEKPYDCMNDLLKFLLLLKKPLHEVPSESFQSVISLEGSSSLINGMDSAMLLNENFSSDFLSKCLSFKKVLNSYDSWTKQFESKFLFPRSFLTPEKESLKTIFSSKLMMLSSKSMTTSEFSEFLCVRNYRSEKSLFSFNGSECNNDSLLLDNFVENPIDHKLPSIKFNSEASCRASWGKSTVKVKRPASTLDEQQNESETWKKASTIELKRNSNYSHSFSILYEKSFKSQLLDDRSNESFLRSKSKLDMKEKQSSNYSNSKEIILGLWEHEQSLIREFRPELAGSFPALRMITVVEYTEDIRYLFTGISSGTFIYDPTKKIFNMVYGTCLDDVTPESLYHFSKDFMEIGNCYMKLMSAIHQSGKNDFNNCTTVSQVFWKSIFEYLELHYSLVLNIPVNTNLMALKSCTRDLHEIIKTVSSICKIDTEEPLPKGGELLTYLLYVAERINKQSVINIVFGILQNCCSVYFMCVLQKWMFNGWLDTDSDEFFVEYRDPKSKVMGRGYYNSFSLIDKKVPVFLKGFEESFYNCGKSVHLLKLFNAEDKFCQLLDRGSYPTMTLCFSDEQLEKLESRFAEYEELVLRNCGPRITIKQIYEEEKERERNYQEFIRGFKALLKQQQEEAQLKRLEDAKAIKEEQNKLLNEQRSAIDAEKERKKQEENAAELSLEMEIKKSEEFRENLINQEKNLMKRYYSEVMEDLDKQIIKTEERNENLRKVISNTSDFPDVLSEIDSEGNILNSFDENLNCSMLFQVIDGGPDLDKSIDLSNLLETQSNITCHSHDNGSINFDENSNPCLETNSTNEEINTKTESQKSVPYRTVASEEAQRNKSKILQSEFGSSASVEHKPTKNKREELTDLERNRQRVLQSEYNILLKKANWLPHVDLTKQKHFGHSDLKSNADDINSTAFKIIGLERKPETIDLCEPEEQARQPVVKISSESCVSSNESVENPLNEPEKSQKELTIRLSSGILNEKYQDALIRDVEIFQKKSSHRTFLCDLKEDLNSLPCTNYLKFQRYLRKSALIALKVQERLANDALLKHILRGEKFLSHLSSLRAYFFLNDGEFGRSFTHHIFRSLTKCSEPTQFFERGNLSNIVNESLNYSIHNLEQNSQNLSFRIVKMPSFLNHSSHDVLSPFELTYKVQWPLNLILTEKALGKYKMVFRFLLKLKRINWTLNENFLYLNWHFKNKRMEACALVGSPHYHKIQIYRHAMTQMMITLDDYIFYNGIQFPWLIFQKDLETTQNIDQLYQKHVKYIKEVLSRCFLTKNCESLLENIHTLIELALKFHYTAKSSPMELVNGKFEHPNFVVLRGTFSEFCSVIKTFLNTLKEKIYSDEILRCHYVLVEKFDLKLT